jgi:nucleoside-diphosphate-sugar epimerase
VIDESSGVNPLTAYAKANRMAEQDVLPLADRGFTVTALRFATVYGYSGRMRFDLAVNGMVLGLFKSPLMPVMRDGTQWRPFVHVKDAASAYKLVLGQPEDAVNGQIFNVGSDGQNYQILPLAELVAESIGIDSKVEWYGSPDSRSYKVSFRKFRDAVGFAPAYTPREGSIEIYEALKSGTLTESPKTKTVEWYKHLIQSHKLASETAMNGSIL